MPIGEANRAVNVDWARRGPDSMLALYQRLLRLRRAEPVLVAGQLTDMVASDGVLQFVRSNGKRRFRVVINLSEETRRVAVEVGVITECTEMRREGEMISGAVQLESAEAVIIGITGAAVS